MPIKPLEDRIIIQPIEVEQTISGLYIPETAQEKPSEAIVLAVGSGIITMDGTRVPLEVQVNDHIMFNKHAGQELKRNGETFVMLHARDVLAIITD